MLISINLNLFNTDTTLLGNYFQATNKEINTSNVSFSAFLGEEIIPRLYIPYNFFLVHFSKPCYKLNITIKEKITPEFAFRFLNTRYYLHFGYYL